MIKKLFLNMGKFIKNKKNWLKLFFFTLLAVTVFLYIKGIRIEREIGRRANYPMAFAEILTIPVYALFFRILKPKMEAKFLGAAEFIFKKASVKYLIAFMALIVTAVIFSMTRFTFFVLQISNIAYFMLVTAVILEVAATVRER
ncbi:MAG: hypothetical protein ABH836_01390 [Candidatus Omnitrophota bacterium]